ncbi:protease complex subunit PrcB family protein [Deinococcus sp.]|uniref:protease complex subunit PrcB family protein n=1 Tax=Deinococcus sp. TaxID=47478 RepID=UPI0025BFC9F1|nr:protease complex subunit PrcB family protein [Deinococcus sp.]
MKRSLFALVGLSAALLTACTGQGPSNFKVHEVALYGGTQQRVVWVYGALGSGGGSSVKLGGAAVQLRPQVQDPLALPGTLSVEGQATYRVPTPGAPQKLSVTLGADGLFNVTPLNGASLAAVYYTDGASWSRLGAASGPLSGVVSGAPSSGLRGAGQLTDAEADALSRVMATQGPLTVAVLNDPAPSLSAEPTPSERLSTSLYLLPGRVDPVPTPALTVTPGLPNPRPQGGQMTGQAVNFTEVASGNNAAATAPKVQLATTPEQIRALYALAYGRQSSVPATPPLEAGRSLVGIFLGQRNTGGYGVRVTGAELSGSTLTVRVAVSSPRPGMLTTQALTSPWTIISITGRPSEIVVVDDSGQLTFP